MGKVATNINLDLGETFFRRNIPLAWNYFIFKIIIKKNKLFAF